MRYITPSRGLSLYWKRHNYPNEYLDNYSSFRSGREALLALLQQYYPRPGKVLLPYWLPEGIYSPFEQAGWEVLFYNLDDLANPSWGEVEAMLDAHAPSLIVLIHYFGLARDRDRLLALLPETCRMIEDWAHSLPYAVNRKAIEDHWALYSPNKLLGITDGAWLEGPQVKPSKQMPSYIYLLWRWLYLIGVTLQYWGIQRIGYHLAGGAYTRSYVYLQSHFSETVKWSWLGRWLLSHAPVEQQIKRRRRQAQYLHQQLNNSAIRSLVKSLSATTILLGYPVRVSQPTHFVGYLAKNNIRVQRFTDRWWFAAKELAGVSSQKLFDEHVVLPLGQPLKQGELEEYIRVLNMYTGTSRTRAKEPDSYTSA